LKKDRNNSILKIAQKKYFETPSIRRRQKMAKEKKKTQPRRPSKKAIKEAKRRLNDPETKWIKWDDVRARLY